MTDEELKEKIKKYRWFHSFKLRDGVEIKGKDWSHREKMIESHMDELDFNNKRVLDVGCRDGYYSFIAESKGASRVYAIDNCLSLGAVELLIPYFKSKVEMAEVGLFDLRPSNGQFDIILFLGVLYHLRYPFWALRTLSDLLPIGGRMILEGGITSDKRDKAMLHCPKSEDSPYKDQSSVTFFNIKGLTDALSSVGIHVDSVKYRDQKDYDLDDENSIIRTSLLCTKTADGPNSPFPEELDFYWRGNPHPNLTKNKVWNPKQLSEYN